MLKIVSISNLIIVISRVNKYYLDFLNLCKLEIDYLNFYKMKLEIEIPDGYVIDKEKSTITNIVLKKSDNLVKNYNDLKNISGYFTDSDSKIHQAINYKISINNKNVTTKKEHCEAWIAFCQLTQLRQQWLENGVEEGGYKVFKSMSDKVKCSYMKDDNLYFPFTFKLEEDGQNFIKTFKDLLQTAIYLL